MLIQALRANAMRSPQGAAIVHGDERILQREFLERIESFARGLAEMGLRPGDRVALVLPNSPAFAIGFFGAVELGAVVVPLNPQFNRVELEYYFRHCEIRALVTDARNLRRCQDILTDWKDPPALISTGVEASNAVSFSKLLQERAPAGWLPERAGDEEAIYMYSSGSTGRPKRVARTHEQCRREAENLMATTGLSPEDRIFCAIPLFHTHGMGNCLLAAAQSGSGLIIQEDPNPYILKRQRSLELIERERATVFPGVPFMFRLLVECPANADLSSLRLCFSAGTALPRSTFEAFLDKFGVPVRQLYGCTEAGSVTINLDPDAASTADSVGKPMVGVDLKVVGEDRDRLEVGATGEIAIRSPAMTRGYFGMEEHNREVFRDGYFFTGDLGRLDGEGRLYLTGRKKLFIEITGNKVDPVEVEDVLSENPRVREVVVVGVKGPVEGEEIVKAVVVPDGECKEKELIDFCQKRLASFKVPRIIEFRDEIPKSPLGKVLRKYLV